jgi:AcrR family transcriptional regulator
MGKKTMKGKKTIQESDPSTEEKIKRAARQVFHQKGFAATRTRDIAEASGINLALLNYYFRSKEKLFDLIMMETLQRFLQSMGTVFHDPATSLDQKFEIVAERYIDLLVEEPDIPLFIMSELRTNPKDLLQHMNVKELLMKSAFVAQFQQAIKEEKIPPQPLLQFLMNMMSLIAFPFIASPIFKNLGNLKDEDFNFLMADRKKMIPKWIKAIIKVKPV